jgi:integrase
MPSSIRSAIGRAVPPPSSPVSVPLSAARLNCSVPISAEAEPARLAWRARAPTAASGITIPQHSIAAKIGGKIAPLPRAACDLLRALPGLGELVFPASRGAAPMAFTKHWNRIAKAAGLPAGVTPHTLRHSFVSVGKDLGYSDSTVGALVGHRSGTMTGRYTHYADAVLLDAADTVADRIALLMGDARPAGVVVAHPRWRAG